MKAMRSRIRSWHLQLQNEKTLGDLSRMFNPVLRGWKQYYARFYPSGLWDIWRSLNSYLVRWVRRKYKRFARGKIRARRYLNELARANPGLFVHWELGCFPSGLSDRSRVS